MIYIRSWAEYETCRDCGKSLVIYGAGEVGRYFVDRNKLRPLYFCDRNADGCGELISEELDIYQVLSLEELMVRLDYKPMDVLVALTKTEHILPFLSDVENVFPDDSTLYFYHEFDVTDKRLRYIFKDVLINGEYVYNGKANVWRYNIDKIMDNYENFHDYDVDEHLSMLKACYKNPDVVTVSYLRKQRAALYESFSKGCFMTLNENRTVRPVRENAVKVYLFGPCQMQSFQSLFENGIENILYNLLNASGLYDVFNYSGPAMQTAYDVTRQLEAAGPAEGSIVVFSCPFKIEEMPYWVLGKQYCDSRNCRFIGVPFAEIYYREVFSDYEKYLLSKLHPVDTAENISKMRRLKRKQVSDFAAYAARFRLDEIYFFSRRFLRSDKALFIDSGHLADWGNEALANDIADIIGFRSRPIVARDTVMNENCEKFVKSLSYMMPDLHSTLEHMTKGLTRFRRAGAIVMNANPFTLGHLYLIKKAAEEVEHLYVFVVEEDKSQFSFEERIKLVREGTRGLDHVTVLPSSKLIISGNTFSEYFMKDHIYQEPDVTLDLHIFGAAVARKLNIKTRFVGEEPFDMVTRHYNEEMKRILPGYGVEVTEIKRCETKDEAISASRVRKLLKSRKFDEIKALVPETTFRFLVEKYGG